MKIERIRTRQRNSRMGCVAGCLGISIAGVLAMGLIIIFLGPTLLNTVLGLAGFEVVGSTDELLSGDSQVITQLVNAEPVTSVTLTTGSYSTTIEPSGPDYTVVTGTESVSGQPQLQITVTETGLLAQCRILTTICSPSSAGLRNAQFDLRPGGMVITGEYELRDGLWQNAGLVVRVAENNTFEIVGVEIGGRVLAPTDETFRTIIDEVEGRGNLFLSGLSARSGANTFQLSNIIIDDTSLALVLR